MIATYDYRCEQCSSDFQIRRDWNANPEATLCPQCHSSQVRRIYSAFMVLSRAADGSVSEAGGNSCGGCAASSCAGCASN